MTAQLINIHDEQRKHEDTSATLKRLYRLLDNNIETLNDEARKQQVLTQQAIDSLKSLT